MTYVSKGERIFAFRSIQHPGCSPAIKRSDARLKRFSSILDDRVWSLEERQRYQYLYSLMSGSQVCLKTSWNHKYIPLEELIKIILAEKDAYIQSLEQKLGITKRELEINELYKACPFEECEEDDETAPCVKSKIFTLTAELDESNKARDTLRKAMHKLEDIEDIMTENEKLKDKLRCSEEMVRHLEEKKSKLEKDLENLRTKSQIEMDLNDAQANLKCITKKEKVAKGPELCQLRKERDNLQTKVCELQNELCEMRTKQNELELLRRKSETAAVTLDELVKENECYKKKLDSMKCLEQRILELKTQANALADKYKRKNSQEKRIEALCEERDRLRRKVDELTCYESQYNSLQCKLRQVDAIISENEMLNHKLVGLDKLEMENKYLRCKLEQCQASEKEAAEGKERIRELQDAVADQEEEMKDLLCQIERLTRVYVGDSELDRLKEELTEKDCRLKLCQEQLAEIPLLEAEIDELRLKLEECCKNMSETGLKQKMDGKTKGTDDQIVFATRYEEPVEQSEGMAIVEVNAEKAVILEKADGENDGMTCEEVQNLLRSSKGIISCVLEDMIEHQKEMEELEKCNREMKYEICQLKEHMNKSDSSNCLREVAELKKLIEEKQRQICCLEEQLEKGGDLGKVNDHISNLECEIEYLKNLNKKMRADLEEAFCEIQRCAELEGMSEEERRARQGLANQVKSKSEKEEYNLETKESSAPTMNELNDLRSQVDELTKLVAELKKENSLLKEVESPCPDYLKQIEEKNELENLLNLLQCELDTCRLTKVEDCDHLRREIEQLKHQNCELKTLVNCYSERLDLEKNSGPHEENRLRSEITHLRCDIIELCKKVEELEAQLSKKCLEIKCLKQCCDNLEKKKDNLEKEVNRKESESEGLKSEVSRLMLEQRRLSTDNASLKSRLKESESPKTREPKEDLEKDMSEKKAIDKTMKILEDHVDGLSQKLEDGNKSITDVSGLLKKQKDMAVELERLKKQLRECKESQKSMGGETSESGAHSEVTAGTQSGKTAGRTNASKMEPIQSENVKSEQVKSEMPKTAETKDLARQAELFKGMAGKPISVKDSVTQTDAVKPVDTKVANTQTEEVKELGTAKQEGVAYPTPKVAQAVPQMMIPIREEQRPATYERGRPVEVTQAHPGSKVAFIETQPKEVKVVVDPKQEQTTRKGNYDQADAGSTPTSKLGQSEKSATGKPSKTALSQPSKAATSQPSKTALSQPSKAALSQPSKAATSQPSKAALSQPSKAATSQPSKAALSQPSKAATSQPSKTALSQPSKAATSQPSKTALSQPSKAATSQPSKTALSQPSKAGTSQPSKTAWSQPSKAATSQPSKTALSQPSKAATSQPSKTALSQPSKAATSQPSKAALSQPSKTAASQPSKAVLLQPSKPATLQPSKAVLSQLSKTAASQPSKAALSQPSKTAASQRSKAALLQLSRGKDGALTAKMAVSEPAFKSTGSDESIHSFSELDPDFSKFLCSLNPENHEENICLIEKRYREKMSELRWKNEEKVKALLNQFERESNMKDKMFKDNINFIKSGYETDIRKLTDRHRASIMQLQSLHEEEIQELNATFETEMDVLHTQNENIVNDITAGAAEKFKMLAEQHNKEIRNLEKKYQKLLEQKEMQHLAAVSTSGTGETSLEDMQVKHKRQLKKLKESNLKRVDLVRHKYEDLISCERKKYEKKLEDLVQRLRQGKAVADGICQCRMMPPCQKDPNVPLEFNDVLRKILTFGLESLDFNEVALVHRMTCAATEEIVLKPEMKTQLLPRIADDPCSGELLMKANKEELLHRILVLENEIAEKQIETQNAIMNMEKEVKAEKKRLLVLRESMRNEREANSELKTKLPDRDCHKSDFRNQLQREKCACSPRGADQVTFKDREKRSSVDKLKDSLCNLKLKQKALKRKEQRTIQS